MAKGKQVMDKYAASRKEAYHYLTEARAWKESTRKDMVDLAALYNLAKCEIDAIRDMTDSTEFDLHKVESRAELVGAIYTSSLWVKENFAEFDNFLTELDTVCDWQE